MRVISKTKFKAVVLVLFFAIIMSACFPGMSSSQNQPVIKTQAVFNPSGTKIAFVSTHDGDADIFVMNRDGTGIKRLTDNTSVDGSPQWSPDGSKIIFASDRSDKFELYIMNADGTEQEMIPTPIEQM